MFGENSLQIKIARGLSQPDAKTEEALAFLSAPALEPVRRFHRSVPGYAPTPLVSLPALADKLGLKGIFVKDEAQRFGLNAFKALGGVYALSRIIGRELGLGVDGLVWADLQRPENRRAVREMVFVTATDGNHGRGVAWAAASLGCRSIIYLPHGSSGHRVAAIRRAGADEAVVTKLSYDDTVRFAAQTAREQGYFLVQDTSWPGYEEIPAWITQGYTTMAAEALEQLEFFGIKAPSHVFLQAGVGAMAGGIAGWLVNHFSAASRPLLATVEPHAADCLYQSILRGDGQPHAVASTQPTIMAGLDCGEPCPLLWPILRDYADFYFSCPDFVAAHGMRRAAQPLGEDPPLVSGESGAVPLGLLELLSTRPELAPAREALGLGADSVVLLFSTEGATDPDIYAAVQAGDWPVPEGKL
jgi:diaminopropionate ammonia-lyase